MKKLLIILSFMLAVSCQATKVDNKGARVDTAAKRHWEKTHPKGGWAGNNYIGNKSLNVVHK